MERNPCIGEEASMLFLTSVTGAQLGTHHSHIDTLYRPLAHRSHTRREGVGGGATTLRASRANQVLDYLDTHKLGGCIMNLTMLSNTIISNFSNITTQDLVFAPTTVQRIYTQTIQ